MMHKLIVAGALVVLALLFALARRLGYGPGSGELPRSGRSSRWARARRRQLHQELEDELHIRRGIADWRAGRPDDSPCEKHDQ